MKNIFTISILAMALSACGGDEAASSDPSKAKSATIKMATNSKLTKFMEQNTVCDVISVETVQKAFKTTLEIKTVSSAYSSKYSNSVTCKYSWVRADAEEREGKAADYLMQQMLGKADKIPMRLRVSEHSFSVRLEEYKAKVENFMPIKLTEEQLEKQIAAANKRAAERLTDEQKKIAGKAATSMMENLLRKNNENIKIDGVGDAAFWTAVAGGGLNVLSGNIKMSITPTIGDNVKQDMKNANTIAKLIVQ